MIEIFWISFISPCQFRDCSAAAIDYIQGSSGIFADVNSKPELGLQEIDYTKTQLSFFIIGTEAQVLELVSSIA